jgi:hypothetical protein
VAFTISLHTGISLFPQYWYSSFPTMLGFYSTHHTGIFIFHNVLFLKSWYSNVILYSTRQQCLFYYYQLSVIFFSLLSTFLLFGSSFHFIFPSLITLSFFLYI